jgi:hypothetical protein
MIFRIFFNSSAVVEIPITTTNRAKNASILLPLYVWELLQTPIQEVK